MLSDQTILDAKPTTTLNEPTIAGLQLRVGPRARTWLLIYRVGARQRKVTLGHWPKMDVDAARLAALEALRDKPEPDDQLTVQALSDEYLRRWAKPYKRSLKDDERTMKHFVKHIGSTRKVISIRRRDLVEWLETLPATPGRGRKWTTVRRCFPWANEVDFIEHDPTYGVKTNVKDEPRGRILTEDELRALWSGLSVSPHAQHAVRLVMLTGL